MAEGLEAPKLNAIVIELSFAAHTILLYISKYRSYTKGNTMRIIRRVLSILVAAALAGLASHTMASDVTGGGATFPYPIYAKWIEAYQAEAGVGIKYQPVGSGQGIKLITTNAVTFGASDMPLKPQDLEKNGLIQFPTVAGGDVPVINLPGISSGQITLDGPTLAAIYLGKITKWGDPAIARLNPRASLLPMLPITVVHRSDGSGTTFIWADYLSTQSLPWRQDVGANTSIDWPVGVGANGNEGVGTTVAQTSGAIGYVEYAYAVQKRLTYTKVINSAGKAVAPSVESFRAAMAAANWEAASSTSILTNQPGDETWPITGATFILMPRNPADLAASKAALKFFKWAYAKGDDMALALNYVPMPPSTVQQIEAAWTKMYGVSPNE